ncbi:MAG: hypothetical protein FWE97_03430 [Dehalococcoidia bacterium]|nr:hypothetical protein [Dehalococcoidia bacterium]
MVLTALSIAAGVFTACDFTPESQRHSLSDAQIEAQLEIQTRRVFFEKSTFPEATFAKTYVLSYYGTFNGCSVVRMAIEGIEFSSIAWQEEIGGIVFDMSYPIIQVFYNGNFFTLAAAYEQGFLIIDNLRAVANILQSNNSEKNGYLRAYIIGGLDGNNGNTVFVSDVDELQHWKSALGNLAGKFTETFFENSQVLMVFFSAGSGGDRFKFGDLEFNNGIVSITIEQTAWGITCDMASWLAVIEIGTRYSPDIPVVVNGRLSTPIAREDWPRVFKPEQFISFSKTNHGIRPGDCEIIDTKDGWVIVGSEIGWAKNGFIAKFDKKGNKLWERYMTMTAGYIQSPCSVIELSDGYLIEMGFILDGYRYGCFIKYDKNGELIWMKEQTVSCAKPHNGGFVGISNDGEELCIVKFDKDGNETLKRNFSSQILDITIAGYYQLYLLSNNGGFLIHGISGNPYDSYMISITAEGTVRWCKNIGLWDYNRFIATENRIVNLKLNTMQIYDFESNFISEAKLNVKENHYHDQKSATKIGSNYFVNGYYSDGNASCYILGFDSFGNVVYEIPRHNAAGKGYGISYHGITASENGIVVLAGYRHYGNPVTVGPHEITLHFLYYDLTTKTFTESSALL